jgi:aspartate kinase
MSFIVLKFGGTSVEDAAAIQRTADIVASRRTSSGEHGGQQPVVVTSAMSKVTDQLLAAAAAAGSGNKAAALELSARIRGRHLEAATKLLSGKTAAAAHQWLEHDCNTLDELLRGIAAVGELTARTTDLVVSFGERLSSRLIAEFYAETGLAGQYVDARTCIITDDQHGKAFPLPELIEARLAEHLLPHLAAGRVPVLGGFIGSTTSGTTTTLGRGGSDYTAALLGEALRASAIEIWTDVDGILTADPRICPEALRVRHISFEEAAELAYFGAKVLHPATILPAVKKNIPVFVLNSRNPASEGTKITALAPRSTSPFKSIAVKHRVTIVDVVASRMLMSHGYLRQIFEVFDRHKCPVDLVSTSEVSVSLTVDSNQAIPAIAHDLSQLADVKYEGQKALLCMVGDDIRGQSGIAAQVFAAIKGVNVRMISQGASEINMSFVIEEEDVPRAVQSLHAHFFANPDPAVFDLAPRPATAAKL